MGRKHDLRGDMEDGTLNPRDVSKVIGDAVKKLSKVIDRVDAAFDGLEKPYEPMIEAALEELGITDLQKLKDLADTDMTMDEMAAELGITSEELQEQLDLLADISDIADQLNRMTGDLFFAPWALLNLGKFENMGTPEGLRCLMKTVISLRNS